MTPSQAAHAARHAAAPAPAPAQRRPVKPILEVVDRRARRRRARRRRVLPVVSALLVSASLIAVVVGHSLLDQDQVRLATVQSEITAAETQQRAETVAVGQLEDPTRIAADAIGQLHMSAASSVVQLPYVSLTTPVPVPDVTPPPSTSSTAPAGGATAGSSGSTTSSSAKGSPPSSATSTGQ